jgi:hypothetical protein
MFGFSAARNNSRVINDPAGPDATSARVNFSFDTWFS